MRSSYLVLSWFDSGIRRLKPSNLLRGNLLGRSALAATQEVVVIYILRGSSLVLRGRKLLGVVSENGTLAGKEIISISGTAVLDWLGLA